MKLSPSIFLCLVIILFSACEKEAIFEDSNLALEFQTQKLTNNSSVSDFAALSLPVPEPDPFEIQLQWTSYISALVLIHHPDIAIAVNNLILQNGKIIPINDLLSMNVVSGENSFNTLFWSYLNLYFHPGRPNHQIIIPGIAGEEPTNELFSMDVIDFMTVITETECVELSFPKGLDLTPQTLIQGFTSTAHPLTTALTNYGYRRHWSLEDPNNSVATYVKTVNGLYVSLNENIIVARPFRNITNCLYEQYDGILFGNYLNN